MSRHRNVRTMNYTDEYDGYDDVYGHSVDDESCISPTDSQQWIFDRERGQQSISTFLENHDDIQEENEDDYDNGQGGSGNQAKQRRDSENFQMPKLNDEDNAKLLSCIDEIRNVVGDSVSERQIVETVMKYNFDFPKSLDAILTGATTPPNIGIKALDKTPIEKDSQTFTNLQDFAKFQLTQSGPKLDSTKKILVPKFGATKLSEEPTKSPSNFSSLSEMAKFHLNDSSEINSSPKFALPKLNSTKSISCKVNPFRRVDNPTDDVDLTADGTLTPLQSSLRKIMDLKKLSLSVSTEEVVVPPLESVISNENWIVDLSNALRNDNSPIPNSETPKSNEDNFIPKFIECDIKPILEHQITQDCEIDCSLLLRKILKLRTRKSSHFGKILCKKYLRTNRPYVRHGFNPQKVIPQFGFMNPSPDDIVRKAIDTAKSKARANAANGS